MQLGRAAQAEGKPQLTRDQATERSVAMRFRGLLGGDWRGCCGTGGLLLQCRSKANSALEGHSEHGLGLRREKVTRPMKLREFVIAVQVPFKVS